MPDQPRAPGSDGPRSPPPRSRWTEIICPSCGHRTGTEIRMGEIRIFCTRCHEKFEVSIKLVEEEVPKPPR